MPYIKDKYLTLEDQKVSLQNQNFAKLLKIRNNDFLLFDNQYTDIMQNLRDAGYLFTTEIIEEQISDSAKQYYTKLIIQNSDLSASIFFVIKNDPDNKNLKWKSENNLLDVDVIDANYDYAMNDERKLIYELITVFPELLV
jgi:hypothetical protein